MDNHRPNKTLGELRLAAFIAKRCPAPDGRIPEGHVYTFLDKDGGVRVSEVGFTLKGQPGDNFLASGADWMRGDLDCAAMILACEDFLLWHDEPVTDEQDPGQEAWRALMYHMDEASDMSNLPPWVERPEGSRYPEAGV